MRSVLFALFLCGVSSQKILHLGVNEKCKNETEPWICKKANSCKTLKPGLKNGSIELCSFSGLEPVICCPPEKPPLATDKLSQHKGPHVSPNATIPGLTDVVPPNAGKVAEQKCTEYAEHVYRWIENPILLPGASKMKVPECYVAETLIVGGTPAKLKEFPHMALIGFKNNSQFEGFCGGSLISPRFILGAAHCRVSEVIGKAFARLGDLDVKSNNDHATPIDVLIIEAFDHPHYASPKAYHDISLFKLEHDVKLGPSIRPLCLQTKRNIPAEKAIATGWGYTINGNKSSASSHLQKVQLKLVPENKYKKMFGLFWNKFPQGLSPEIVLFAGGEEGKDTCQGDSGGPLQIPLKTPFCMYSILGVTAFGIGCGITAPGGYTRVSYYVPWIESIVWPEK